jgi:hypothetical protein
MTNNPKKNGPRPDKGADKTLHTPGKKNTGNPSQEYPFDMLKIYRALEGTIDLHIHGHPDCSDRLLSDLEVAAQAKAVKMRAIMLKSHIHITANRAKLAQKILGGGIEVYGMICLNPAVGGLSPNAVKKAIDMGAKAVWMPSMWAENHAQYVRQSRSRMGYETMDFEFPKKGETILGENDKIKPEVIEILKMVSDSDLMLSTGHLNLHEAHLLLDEANNLGIKKLLVHTVNYHVLDYPLEEQEKLIKKGAFLEFGFTSLPGPVWGPVDPSRNITLDDVCASIRSAGVEHCILTTDSGQITSPPPIECMRQWIELLKLKGFNQGELDTMTKINPAKLLGLI